MEFRIRPFSEQPPLEVLSRLFDDVYGVIPTKKLISRVGSFRPSHVEVSCTLDQVGRAMSMAELLARFKRRGVQAASYEALLGFAKRYPNIQRGVQVIAPGSTVTHGRHVFVPCIWGNTTTRGIKLVRSDDVSFESDYWYLTVRMDA